MARLKPTFSLTIGGLTSSSDTPAFGPRAFSVWRDMDIPADALRIQMFERAGINLEDELSLDLGYDGENEPVFTGKVVKIRPTLDGLSIYALGKLNDLLNLRSASSDSALAITRAPSAGE